MTEFTSTRGACNITNCVSSYLQESGVGHIPDRLRFVPVPVMKLAQCQRSYRFYITPRMMCAGYATGGKDACNVCETILLFWELL